MKKFALLFSILFLAIFLVGCGAAAPVSPFRDEMPWGTAYDAFEESEFAVRVFAFPENSDDDEILVGTGEMSHTLSATGDGQNNVITISSSRKINWLDVPEARENRNLTNLSTSEVSFRRAGLVPLSSTRTETMENRYHEDGTFWYNQSFVSRAYYADYPTAALRRTSTISFGKNAQGAWLNENHAIPIRSGPVFDNEQLSFLLRALGNFSSGAMANLNFNNVFRNYVIGSNAFIPLRINVNNLIALPAFEGDDWNFL
ncbi:MAG: hypothetical protein FWC82_02615, partial [Firmicutes bacterium]|nr:hypothetical protein [Bacillota bacterium]